jgi:hypothetical protein
MEHDPDAGWSAEEAAALARLRTPGEPPRELGQRVLDTLHARGQIRLDPSPARRLVRPALATAAAIVLFLAGMNTGARTAEQPAAAAAHPRYMLILFEDESYSHPEPGREGERAAEYGRWAASLSARGMAIQGDELLPGGQTLTAADGRIIMEPGVPVTGAGRIAGYFIVDSDNADQALDLARDTPHLRHGGRVAVVPLAGH